MLSLLYYSTTPFRSNYAAVSCSGSNLGESDFTPSVKNLFLHLWYVKFLKREVVLKNPTFSHLTRCNSAFSSTLSNFISAFFACIFFIYTRFRKGAKSFSPCALSTPSLMAMKRTFFCGKIISLIWTRPQNQIAKRTADNLHLFRRIVTKRGGETTLICDFLAPFFFFACLKISR